MNPGRRRKANDAALQHRSSRARTMRNGGASTGHTDGHTDQASLVALGAVVRGLRVGAGLSVSGLARRSTCAPSTISRLERGQLRPRRSLLVAVGWGIDPDRASELREMLFTAVGDGLAADTAGWQRYRQRRAERGILTGDVPLPGDLARRIDAHRREAEARQVAHALLDTPGALDDAEVLARADQLMAVANEAAVEAGGVTRAGGVIQIGVGKRRVVYGI